MCVVKGPAQGAMAKTKRVEEEKKTVPPQKKETRARAESKESSHFEPAYSKSTLPQSRPLNEENPQSRPLNEENPQSRPLNEEEPQSRPLNEEEPQSRPLNDEDPQSRPLNEEDPQSRPLNEEDPQSRPLNEENPQSRPLNENPESRALEEDTTRLSASSEETVLDTPLAAQGKERASTSTQSSSSRSEEDQRVMNVTVMSKGNEITTALTVLGKVPKPVHENKKDEGIMEVDYEPSSDEGEQPALRNPLSCVQLALRVEPTTTLIREPSSHHERRSEDNTSDSELSITSDLIMKESLNAVEICKASP